MTDERGSYHLTSNVRTVSSLVIKSKGVHIKIFTLGRILEEERSLKKYFILFLEADVQRSVDNLFSISHLLNHFV